MEVCIRCGVSGEDIRLFDAIYEGRMEAICQRCSIIENIPVIKKPDSSQLKESEKGIEVYKRMKRLSGIKDFKKKEIYFREDKLNELESNPDLELPEEERLNLIDYFHWEIMKNRRRKGLSQKQLAETIGESEIAIQMIEKKEFPENSEVLIKKLEQFFQIKLKKISEIEKIMNEKEKKPILLDEKGRELEIIPEKPVKQKFEIKNKDIKENINYNEKEQKNFLNEKTEPVISKNGDLNIKETDIDKITIKDLKELHRKKIEATKQEKIEEQKKIEARQRLIEAQREEKQRLIDKRKEELRMIKEKESKEIDKKLGGMELLNKKEKNIWDSNNIKEFDEELI